jgi:SAM-dependent methyltransferase
MSSDFDRANRLVWGSREVVELFLRRQGFSSDAEAHVMRRVATAAKDQPILDVGVGGGRTVPFLRALSTDYVGIDFVEALVDATRHRYPDARVEHMDARNLSRFGDEMFALVVFSANGIDGVSHADRPRVFNEFHRVLRPGGLLAYSTHNLDHRPPGRMRRHFDPRPLLKRPGYAARRVIRLPRTIREYRRLRALSARGEGWASVVNWGYGRPVIWHRVTFAESVRELRDSGFTTVELYSSAGLTATVDAASPSLDAAAQSVDAWRWWTLHLVAHKGDPELPPGARRGPRGYERADR